MPSGRLKPGVPTLRDQLIAIWSADPSARLTVREVSRRTGSAEHTVRQAVYSVRRQGRLRLTTSKVYHLHDREVARGVDDATARLTDAAPHLLAACKRAAQWLDGWASAEPYLSELEEAICKAEGPHADQQGRSR